jgi:hypothetical protein
MIVMCLRSGWPLYAHNRLLSCGDGCKAMAVFSQHAGGVETASVVVAYCVYSMSEKCWYCRKRGTQATLARHDDFAEVTRAWQRLSFERMYTHSAFVCVVPVVSAPLQHTLDDICIGFLYEN